MGVSQIRGNCLILASLLIRDPTSKCTKLGSSSFGSAQVSPSNFEWQEAAAAAPTASSSVGVGVLAFNV